MKKSLRYALGIVALVVLAIILVRVFTAQPPKARRASIPPVVVERPQRTDIKYTLEYDGDVLPILQANVFSRVKVPTFIWSSSSTFAAESKRRKSGY